MSESPRRIALFGGTFDPVHLGHLHLAAQAREAFALDEVRFLPCRLSPHKTDRAPASGTDRMRLLALATADLPWAVVDGFELDQPEPSYSYRTAEAMKARFPGAQLYWIMGSDQWRALPGWKHPERLAACVEFLVLPREGDIPSSRPGFRMHLLSRDHPASATSIRQALAAGAEGHAWLPAAAAEWLAAHPIYRSAPPP